MQMLVQKGTFGWDDMLREMDFRTAYMIFQHCLCDIWTLLMLYLNTAYAIVEYWLCDNWTMLMWYILFDICTNDTWTVLVSKHRLTISHCLPSSPPCHNTKNLWYISALVFPSRAPKVSQVGLQSDSTFLGGRFSMGGIVILTCTLSTICYTSYVIINNFHTSWD